MTTYPLSAPPISVTTEELTLAVKQGVAQSPFSGASTIINNFAQWQVRIAFVPLKRGSSTEKAMAGWLSSLNGSMGSFLYYPKDYGKGGVTGKTLGSTGYAYSNAISVAGWSGSSPTGLEVGDLFSIGNSLFRITAVPITATGGSATINFEPALREDVASGTAINFATPRVELYLASGEDGQGHSKDDSFTYFPPLSAVQVL